VRNSALVSYRRRVASGTSLPRANAASQRSDSSSCSGDGSVPVAPGRAVVEFPGPLVSEGHLDLSGQLHFCLANPARREITVVSNELHRLAECSVLGRPPTVRAVFGSPGYRHNPILPILYPPPSRMAQLPCGLHMLGDMRVAATVHHSTPVRSWARSPLTRS
jgi:hypothetical protein